MAPPTVSLQAEYIRLSDERRGQSVEDGDLSPLIAQGWYASGTYAFTRKRNRFGLVEGAARYETLSFGSRSRGLGAVDEPARRRRARQYRSCRDTRRELDPESLGEAPGQSDSRSDRQSVDGPESRTGGVLEPGVPFTADAVRHNA